MISQKTILKQKYKEFSLAKGSQHIASEYAIMKMQQLITHLKIISVLEVGLGIGSIAGSLLPVNKNLNYSGTEANEFCLQALPENLDTEYQRLEVFSSLTKVPKHKEFELVIIDGKDSGLILIKDLISRRGIIAVEGDRMPQQELLRKFFPHHKYVHSISRQKNKAYSPFSADHWQGGLKFIFVDPSVKQKIWWFKETVSTKFKYLYRNSQ